MKILIVSPYFPPDLSVATVRISSLTRYLIEKGAIVTVLTNETVYKKAMDPEDEFIMENVNIINVESRNNNRKFFEVKKVYETYIRKMLNESKFDLVLITAGPFYTLSLSKIIKKEFLTPVILDFRDLWILDIRELKEFIRPNNILKKLIFLPIEMNAIKYADKVITVTDGWANILRKQYPFYKEKIKVIYNGFDSDKFKSLLNSNQKKNNDNNVIRIMNFGKLSYYSQKYAHIFFEAVEDLIIEGKKIEVVQIGELEKTTVNILNNLKNANEHFSNTGFKSYKEGISILSTGDVYIIIDIRKNALGTKVYDYILLNKPIIYIGRKNTDLSNFIGSIQNSFICSTKEEVKKALKMIEKNNLITLTEDNVSSRYSRTVQNEKFLNEIKKTI